MNKRLVFFERENLDLIEKVELIDKMLDSVSSIKKRQKKDKTIMKTVKKVENSGMRSTMKQTGATRRISNFKL